jgi:hypothetical protein
MKELKNFVKNTYFYEQVKRVGNLAVYKQRLEEGRGCLAYEVIYIRRRAETKLFDNIMPAAEYGPSNEEFGHFGFSFPTLELAEKRFDELIETNYYQQNDIKNAKIKG